MIITRIETAELSDYYWEGLEHALKKSREEMEPEEVAEWFDKIFGEEFETHRIYLFDKVEER